MIFGQGQGGEATANSLLPDHGDAGDERYPTAEAYRFHDDDDDGEISFMGKRAVKLPPPASAWLAESQAEKRRECEPRSASKPSVTAGNGGCRVKSAATRGRKRKTEEHQPR